MPVVNVIAGGRQSSAPPDFDPSPFVTFLARCGDQGSPSEIVEAVQRLEPTVNSQAAISENAARFGSESAEFSPGASQNPSQAYIFFPYDIAIDLSDTEETGFTVECWVRFKSLSRITQVFMADYHVADGIVARSWFFSLSDGTLRWRHFPDGVNAVSLAESWSPSIDTWYHVAACRDLPGTTRLFVDGAQLGSGANLDLTIPSLAGQTGLRLGKLRSTGGDSPLEGFLEECRITKFPLYTETFTPPSAPFPTP